MDSLKFERLMDLFHRVRTAHVDTNLIFNSLDVLKFLIGKMSAKELKRFRDAADDFEHLLNEEYQAKSEE